LQRSKTAPLEKTSFNNAESEGEDDEPVLAETMEQACRSRSSSNSSAANDADQPLHSPFFTNQQSPILTMQCTAPLDPPELGDMLGEWVGSPNGASPMLMEGALQAGTRGRTLSWYPASEDQMSLPRARNLTWQCELEQLQQNVQKEFEEGSADSLSYLRRRYNEQTRGYEVLWRVDERKLKGGDKQIISPFLPLYIRGMQREVLFKIMIYAAPRTVLGNQEQSDKSESFKKTEGHGKLVLKCENWPSRSELADAGEAIEIQFSVARSGGRPLVQQWTPRLQHHFGKIAVCCLPKKTPSWDFNQLVSQGESTFDVHLHIYVVPGILAQS